MVVFIPNGSVEDSTRAVQDFDSVHRYLARCGVRPLASVPGQPIAAEKYLKIGE